MGLRFKLKHLVDVDSLRVDRTLAKKLKKYMVSVEVDLLTQTITISTQADLAVIKLNTYTKEATIYRRYTQTTCSIEDTAIDIENNAIHVVCESNPIKRLLKQLKVV